LALKAVVFDGSLSCRDVPMPEEGGSVILSVVKAGICGTDLAIASGTYPVKTPLILGHEIFGMVRTAPRSGSNLTGRRAVTEINVACGRCDFCKAGMKTHCVRGQALGIHRDGGFAEYVSTPSENVHLVPDSISDDEAVFIEPLAACIQLTKMSRIDSGSTCAVVGPGRMGLLILQLLKLINPRLIVAIGREGAKLDMARSIGVKAFDLADTERVLQLTGGSGFDNVIEATGTPAGLDQSMKMVKPRGTIHLKSTHGLPAQLDATKVVVDELRIQGSRCGPFDEAIELLDQQAVEVKHLITHRYPLERCREAFETASSRFAIKTIFDI
jgi:threonine dehydrogenase-like Zn-dependent dehydrogenase